MDSTTAQSIPGALAEVDHWQAQRVVISHPSGEGELPALRDLAEAVRAHRAPLVDVTEHDGYTVRAVIPGGFGATGHWHVAAQGGPGFDHRWSTWYVHVNRAGELEFSAPVYQDTPLCDNKFAALTHLVHRSGL